MKCTHGVELGGCCKVCSGIDALNLAPEEVIRQKCRIPHCIAFRDDDQSGMCKGHFAINAAGICCAENCCKKIEGCCIYCDEHMRSRKQMGAVEILFNELLEKANAKYSFLKMNKRAMIGDTGKAILLTVAEHLVSKKDAHGFIRG